MKHIMTFEGYKPNDKEVEEIIKLLKKEYPIKERKVPFGKSKIVLGKEVIGDDESISRYVMVDDIQVYLGNPLGSKVTAMRKIANDFKSEKGEKYTIASINKAIKEYIK